jgi:hypothetical protein
VLRFLAGFLTGCLVWGGFLYAYKQGLVNLDLEPEVEEEVVEAEAELDEPKQSAGPKKRKGRRARGGKRRYQGESQIGDDLGDPSMRNLHAATAGGEEQLLGSEIERGFDGAMSSIRRCLILAASDEPVTGKLIFGVRISGAGRVERVQLKGPSAITQSEAGGCLTQAARSIKFRSFDGPDMLVNYPLTLQ